MNIFKTLHNSVQNNGTTSDIITTKNNVQFIRQKTLQQCN